MFNAIFIPLRFMSEIKGFCCLMLRRVGKYLLQAIRDVTPLPVTALVYSHTHVDHIGDSPFWNDEAKKEGVNLRIIAVKPLLKKCNL